MTHVTIAFRAESGTQAVLAPELINTPDPDRVVCYTPCWPEKATPRRRGVLEAALIGNAVAAVGKDGGIHVPVNGCVVSAPAADWGEITGHDLKKIKFISYRISEKARAELGDIRHAIEAGPALVEGGQPNIVDVPFLNDQGFVLGAPPFPAFNSVLTHHRLTAPRVCAGADSEGGLIVALFEGRRPGESEGVTLTEAAQLMAAAGCREAVNLDGGASAELILHGKPINTLQLGPADKKWLDRGLDFLNRHMRSGTLPRTEDLGGADERAIGSALMIVRGK